MAALTRAVRTWAAISRVAYCLLGLGLPALLGCHSGIYRPATLPDPFQAPPLRDVEAIDLTRLSLGAERNDAIYVGDVLQVTVATGIEEGPPPTWTLRVADDGSLAVPLVGPVRVAGLGLIEAEQSLTRACIERRVYQHPIVSVTVGQRRTNRVTVLGAVNKPGVRELPSTGSDLLAALVAAGGPSEEADTIVEIRQPPGYSRPVTAPRPDGAHRAGRPSHELVGYWEDQDTAGQAVSIRVDLASASATGQNHYLHDGAAVMVRKQPARTIQVIGLVNRADQFELPANQEVRVLDALSLAQGRTLQLADKVRVIRHVPDHPEPVIIELSVRKAKHNGVDNLRLAPGDVVSVEETPLTFTVETLRSFIRFGFSSAIPGI